MAATYVHTRAQFDIIFRRTHSWLYRLRPAVCHEAFQPFTGSPRVTRSFGGDTSHNDSAPPLAIPNQLRWSPFDVPTVPTDFVEGLATVCGAGDPAMRSGMAVHVYCANRDMQRRAMQNADGDMLVGMGDQLSASTCSSLSLFHCAHPLFFLLHIALDHQSPNKAAWTFKRNWDGSTLRPMRLW